MYENYTMQTSIASLQILVIFPVIALGLWHLLDLAMVYLTVARHMTPEEKSKPCAYSLLSPDINPSGKFIFISFIASTILLSLFPNNIYVLAALYTAYGCSFVRRTFDLTDLAAFEQSCVYKEWLCLSMSFYLALALFCAIFLATILLGMYSPLMQYITTSTATIAICFAVLEAIIWLMVKSSQIIFWEI